MPFSDKNKLQVIRKSNELIEARYKLSIAEQRLVLLLASEISPEDEDFKGYEIRVADFVKMFGLEKDKSIYEKVEQAAESLLSQKIILQDDKTKEVTNWLSYVKYVKGSGVVNLEFHKSLKPYLLQLKGHYTQYQINYVMNFKSQYSIRLYELLKMDAYRAKYGKFEKTFEIAALRLILAIDKKDYPLFANFKQKVILPATNEISDKTDLFINDAQYGKTGRKITHVTFFVGVRSENETRLRQADLRIEDIKPENASENHPIIDSLVSLGFSFEIAKAYKTKHGVKKIERNIAYTLAKKQEGIVKDLPAYLNMAIENDYGGAWDIERQKTETKKKWLAKHEQEKQAQEAKEKKAIEERNKAILECFYALPEGVKEIAKQNFIATYEKGSFISKEWGKAEKANKNPLDKMTIKGNFIQFLIEKNICMTQK